MEALWYHPCLQRTAFLLLSRLVRNARTLTLEQQLWKQIIRTLFLRLSSTDHCSMKISLFYSAWQQLSMVSGGGLSQELPSGPLHQRYQD